MIVIPCDIIIFRAILNSLELLYLKRRKDRHRLIGHRVNIWPNLGPGFKSVKDCPHCVFRSDICKASQNPTMEDIAHVCKQTNL